MCRGAEFAYNPAHLPDLAEGSETLPVEFEEQPCFYTARAIKGDKDYEMKETVFTRATGAFFFNGRFITLYNIGGDMAKLWENSEAKMKDNLFIINRNNGGRYLEKSPACIMLTENEMHVVNTLRYVYNKRANKHKDYTQSSFYRHVYAIPLSSDGMRILRLFHLGDWQEILARKICPKERGWLTTDNRFAVDNGKTFYYNFKRSKCRERRRTKRGYLILSWIRWQEHYYQRYKNILKRRKEKRRLKTGKKNN